MSGFPEELIFILVFGFVWIMQFLRRRRRRLAPPASGAGRDAEIEAEAEAQAPAAAKPRPAPQVSAVNPNLAEGARRAPMRRDRPAPSPPARQTARRYSRSALMGDRRAVQDAMVIATILQPCRAKQPYGSD